MLSLLTKQASGQTSAAGTWVLAADVRFGENAVNMNMYLRMTFAGGAADGAGRSA